MKQIGENATRVARRGAMEPSRARRVHAELLANPAPRPGLGINRRRAARHLREDSRVETQFWFVEVREGRRNRQGGQGTGGFAERCGPVRFRAMCNLGATHLCNLAQAFLINLPRVTAHAEWPKSYPPSPLKTEQKTSNAKKTQTARATSKEWGPARNIPECVHAPRIRVRHMCHSLLLGHTL